MTTKTLSTDIRLTTLEDCENKIQSAFRRGLDATCVIAKELIKINKEELYTAAGLTSMKLYLSDRAKMDERSYRRIIEVSQTVKQLQDEGLELPANESQVAELSRLDQPSRVKVWHDLLVDSEKLERRLTLDDVRKAVESAEKPAGGGIEVEMGDNGTGTEPAKPEAEKEGELVLTEKGEAALVRIRKVCGDTIADAIEDGTKAMTEREMRGWAEYDDSTMLGLSYYIMDRNWPLSKAVNFANKDVVDTTDVKDLILIANSRGGKTTVTLGNARITVEITQV